METSPESNREAQRRIKCWMCDRQIDYWKAQIGSWHTYWEDGNCYAFCPDHEEEWQIFRQHLARRYENKYGVKYPF